MEEKDLERQTENEEPFLTTSVTVDKALQARIQGRMRGLGVVLTVLGALLLIAYIVLGVLFETWAEEGKFTITPLISGTLNFSLWVGAFLLVLGLIFAFGGKLFGRAQKMVYRNTYSFYGDHVMIGTEREGEIVSTTKYYYADFMLIKRAGDLLLFYIQAGSAYAVDLKPLTQEDRKRLLQLIPKKKGRHTHS